MSKKILMIAYANYMSDGRIRREGEALVARGDHVDIIVHAEEGYPREQDVSGVHVYRLPIRRYRGSNSFHYGYSYLLFFLAATWTATSLFFKCRYDVVHVHTLPDFMVFTALIPRLFGAGIVLDMHDMIPELYMSKFPFSEKHTLVTLLKFEERVSFGFADRIICVHHPHKALLVRRGAPDDRISIVMNLPDPNLFNLMGKTTLADPSSFRMVYHGTVAARLGVDVALKAFTLVVKEIPQAHFDIYGDGDASPMVINDIRRLDLDNNVYFSGRRFRIDEIPKLLNGAALGVIPNRKDLATDYMLPGKLMEYAYLGIPIVSADLSTIRYYMNDSCVTYFQPDNHFELASSIIELFRNPHLGEEKARRAQRVCERYSWDRMKLQLFQTIDEASSR